MMLPLYKATQQHLEHSRNRLRGVHTATLRRAIANGLHKLGTYIEKALVSKYPLLGAGECSDFTGYEHKHDTR